MKTRNTTNAARRKAGKRLRAVREEYGLSQADMYHRTGVPQATISRWERMGPPQAVLDMLWLLEDLGMGAYDFLGEPPPLRR